MSEALMILLTTTKVGAFIMAKVTFSRKDIESLADRLLDRGRSPLMDDMPSTQRDLRCAAAILKYVTAQGVPPTVIEIDVNNDPHT